MQAGGVAGRQAFGVAGRWCRQAGGSGRQVVQAGRLRRQVSAKFQAGFRQVSGRWQDITMRCAHFTRVVPSLVLVPVARVVD